MHRYEHTDFWGGSILRPISRVYKLFGKPTLDEIQRMENIMKEHLHKNTADLIDGCIFAGVGRQETIAAFHAVAIACRDKTICELEKMYHETGRDKDRFEFRFTAEEREEAMEIQAAVKGVFEEIKSFMKDWQTRLSVIAKFIEREDVSGCDQQLA